MNTPDSLLGQVLSRSYRLERLLTEGGASLVFEAERLRPPRRQMVVKLLHPMLINDKEMYTRFQHEAEVLGKLRHDNVVELYDMGHTDEDLPFHVMELLVGETLRERLERDGRCSPEEVALLVRQAASALKSLHYYKVVHRDVNPRNLFLADNSDSEPQVKLIDFSLALRISQKQQEGQLKVIGSEGYMSPEQFRGEVHKMDATTDVFALGVVAYEMLCGRRPFEAKDEDELLHQVCNTDPTPVTAWVKGLSPQVNRVLTCALAKDKDERHSNIEAFANELSAALEETRAFVPLPAIDEISTRTELETEPSYNFAPAGEEPGSKIPVDGSTPETDEQNLLGGMTLMDSAPPKMAHMQADDSAPVAPCTSEAIKTESGSGEQMLPQDPALAGQTLLGDDDLLDELMKAEGAAADPHSTTVEESQVDPLDGQTIMDPILTLDPNSDEAALEEPLQQDPTLAGQTLVADDDLMDELSATGGDEPDSSTVNADHLDGLTIMDEVIETEPDMGEEEPSTAEPANATPPDASKIVTAYQGDAWAEVEELAKRNRKTPSSVPVVLKHKKNTVGASDIKRPEIRTHLLAAIFGIFLVLVLVLYFLVT